MSNAGRQYFSELEKSLLTELVNKHKNILESKRNDFKIIKQKQETWESLSEQFNSQSGVKKRGSKQLKKCWENIKSRAKKSIAKKKREAKLTSGGKSSAPDETASAVAPIIPSQIDSLSNPYDDDNVEKEEQDDLPDVQHKNNSRESYVDDTTTAATVTPNNPDETRVQSTSSASSVRNVKKTQVTPAQSQCLAMQKEQHQAEMEYIKKKIENLDEEHKRKMDVLGTGRTRVINKRKKKAKKSKKPK